VYDDYLLPPLETRGLMGCYCKEYTTWWSPATLFTEFKTGTNDKGKDEFAVPCFTYHLEWLCQEFLFVVALTIAIIINSLVSSIFLKLGKYVKSHTEIDEHYYSFKYIFCMEIINMGIIQLVISLYYF